MNGIVIHIFHLKIDGGFSLAGNNGLSKKVTNKTSLGQCNLGSIGSPLMRNLELDSPDCLTKLG
jgi:hypothetical protein